MLKSIRRFLLKLAVTPKRVRSLIASAISLFLRWAMETKAWDAVSQLPRWLRLLADFIDSWNATDLPEDQDRLIAELVKRALTDEDVGRLIDEIAALECRGGEGDDGL